MITTCHSYNSTLENRPLYQNLPNPALHVTATQQAYITTRKSGHAHLITKEPKPMTLFLKTYNLKSLTQRHPLPKTETNQEPIKELQHATQRKSSSIAMHKEERFAVRY